MSATIATTNNTSKGRKLASLKDYSLSITDVKYIYAKCMP